MKPLILTREGKENQAVLYLSATAACMCFTYAANHAMKQCTEKGSCKAPVCKKSYTAQKSVRRMDINHHKNTGLTSTWRVHSSKISKHAKDTNGVTSSRKPINRAWSTTHGMLIHAYVAIPHSTTCTNMSCGAHFSDTSLDVHTYTTYVCML